MAFRSLFTLVILPLLAHSSTLYSDKQRTAGQAEWGYDDNEPHGPSNWRLLKDTACGGRFQSPVQIYAEDVDYRPDLPLMEYQGYGSPVPKGQLTAENNGHSFTVKIPPSVDVKILAGGLPDWYRLAQFHFHWSDSDNAGMEHIIGEKRYPLVAHFVHTKRGLKPDLAMSDPQGIAVLAVPFELTPEGSPEIRKIANAVQRIPYQGEKIQINEEIILFNLLPRSLSFFRYNGSLTTPPCSETVIWTIYTDPVPVGRTELDHFRRFFKREGGNLVKLKENHRPVQPLNGRRVWVTKPVELESRGQCVLRTDGSQRFYKGNTDNFIDWL